MITDNPQVLVTLRIELLKPYMAIHTSTYFNKNTPSSQVAEVAGTHTQRGAKHPYRDQSRQPAKCRTHPTSAPYPVSGTTYTCPQMGSSNDGPPAVAKVWVCRTPQLKPTQGNLKPTCTSEKNVVPFGLLVVSQGLCLTFTSLSHERLIKSL
jgi:hypothetical protein